MIKYYFDVWHYDVTDSHFILIRHALFVSVIFIMLFSVIHYFQGRQLVFYFNTLHYGLTDMPFQPTRSQITFTEFWKVYQYYLL